ncbi:hypothetical protein SDC9_151532 [bioreactor metagenome]|uniref:Uncharacterized protein n=1 Tax=bioreactor metagenome TaxID=1076179 RepID=A0A645ES77_9ZZZZ
MPGQRRVQSAPKLVPGHKRLCRAALLAGAAIQHHGAGTLRLLQIGLHADGRCHGPGAQQIVPAAMAAATGNQFFPVKAPPLLGQAGQRVVFRQNPDDGPPRAKGRGKGRGNIANPLFHDKALVFQHLAVQRGGPLLL